MQIRSAIYVLTSLIWLDVLCGVAGAQTASPSPSPAPNVTWQINLSGYDLGDVAHGGSRTDYGNLLASVTRGNGRFRFGAVLGGYAFPVTGQPLNPTFSPGSNTGTFGPVPIAYVQYVPNSTWAFTVGKMPTLIGQENVFTFQNINVQRGLAWSQETTVSRGARATYVRGKFTGNLEYNDGFYSGRLGALEGAAQWSPSLETTIAFAFLVPPTGALSNPTATIANKRESDLMLTQHIGKLLLTPYLQWIASPRSVLAGYKRDERAFAGVLLADYSFDQVWSVGARFESLTNRSDPADGSLNADLIGFGAGSAARSLTITPTFKARNVTVRAEYSRVDLLRFIRGSGFGPGGTAGSQVRLGLELGTQF